MMLDITFLYFYQGENKTVNPYWKKIQISYFKTLYAMFPPICLC